ncbi:uncharacterized protein BDV17DRAFT_262863 [Aspergillus undulatus]|uniref:uncharacterized protein n=1 Tax=Aspergillus undulatus TaxID=1810928 RepID=UPI003CCD9EF7
MVAWVSAVAGCFLTIGRIPQLFPALWFTGLSEMRCPVATSRCALKERYFSRAYTLTIVLFDLDQIDRPPHGCFSFLLQKVRTSRLQCRRNRFLQDLELFHAAQDIITIVPS